jgi:hypothetical protein
MPRKDEARGKAGLPVGLFGASLSVAGAVCAASGPAHAAPLPEPAQVRPAGLYEEELFDSSLASFYVFDRENPGGRRPITSPTRVAYCRGCRWCRYCRCRA